MGGGFSNNSLQLSSGATTSNNTSVDVESGVIDFKRKGSSAMKTIGLLALLYFGLRVYKKV